jgi:hypothetical protein
MNIWSIIEEKRVMIIQISFSNEINEGLSVPRKTNLCTFSAEWFSLKNAFFGKSVKGFLSKNFHFKNLKWNLIEFISGFMFFNEDFKLLPVQCYLAVDQDAVV